VPRRLLAPIALVLGLIGPTAALRSAPSALAAAGPVTVAAPITAALVQGNDTWLVVPMGHLGQFLNTFWQLFVRTSPGTGWVTATPPGVADNGGLVITIGPGGGLLAGFLASQDLTFSPLSETTDAGRTWAPVYFQEGLISVPDALAGSTSGVIFGLGRSRRGTLLETAGSLSSTSSWRSTITETRLARSSAGVRCGIQGLTATAVTSGGDPIVGVACGRPGSVGLFDVAGGKVKAVAFPVASALTRATISVLRLMPTTTGLAVVLRAHEPSGRTVMVAGWLSGSTTSGALSASLPVPTGGKVLASGTTSSGGVFVLLSSPHRGGPELSEVSPASIDQPSWDVLPDPPRGTLGAAFSLGRIDAVTVHSSTLIDYTLDQSSATWVQSQVVHVPIQYGSSS
jgi:hypothetical protein